MKARFALLAAAIAAVNAQSVSYICQTSDASPYLNNINEMIDNLNNAPQGENLCNVDTNGCSGTITGYSGSGGAAFMICGSSYRCSGDPGGIPCAGSSCGGISAREAGEDFAALRDQCQGPDSKGDIRAGGIYQIDLGNGIVNELKLFSKPG